MINIREILKTYYDENEFLWQAIYINNFKIKEDKYLTNDVILNYLTENYYEIRIYSCLNDNNLFPEYEDFSYLLDYRDLGVGDFIYLEDGCYEIINTTEDYRKEGYYPYYEYYFLNDVYVPFKTYIFYNLHPVKKLEFKNGKEVILEDYHYRQSYLFYNNN